MAKQTKPTNPKIEEKNAQDHCCGGDCDCSHDQGFNIEDVAFSAHYKIDALLSLMIKKKVFTKEEYQKEIDTLYKSIEEEARKHQH